MILSIETTSKLRGKEEEDSSNSEKKEDQQREEDQDHQKLEFTVLKTKKAYLQGLGLQTGQGSAPAS
jgi:hypothetical protein